MKSSIKLAPAVKINNWTLLDQEYFTQKNGRRRLKWRCRCKCGTEALVARGDLLANKSTKCRNCSNSMPRDLSGQKFGRWTAISCNLKKHNRRYCKCRCDCGSIYEVAAQTLINGASTQCINCFNIQRDGSNYTGHPLYQIWKSMHNRCELKSNWQYKNYGGRGIKVCKRWDNLSNFINDMGARPSKRHSIDRIDNNKGYNPENCRWASYKQQANNRRSNRIISYNGKCLTLSQWAIVLDESADSLWHFLNRNNNNFHYVYMHFINKDKKLICQNFYKNGIRACSLTKWHSQYLGISTSSFLARLNKLKSLKEVYYFSSLNKQERRNLSLNKYNFMGQLLTSKQISKKLNIKHATLCGFLRNHSIEDAINRYKHKNYNPNGKIRTYKNKSKITREWASQWNIKNNTLNKFLERHSFEEAYQFYAEKV